MYLYLYRTLSIYYDISVLCILSLLIFTFIKKNTLCISGILELKLILKVHLEKIIAASYQTTYQGLLNHVANEESF